MVKSANMNGLLDSDSDSLSSCQQRVKARLHEILQKDRDFTAEDYEKVSLSKFFYTVKYYAHIKCVNHKLRTYCIIKQISCNRCPPGEVEA